MLEEVIQEAIHWWCAERHGRGIDPNVRNVLPFAFKTLDSLYVVTKALPDVLADVMPTRIQQGGLRNIVLQFPISVETYTGFRSSLAFAGDLFCLLRGVSDSELMELSAPLKKLLDEASRFRHVRNFFTHLDERITNLSEHGISGQLETDCGIFYKETARDCFHLVLAGNTLHFTEKKRPIQAEVGRHAFDPIFSAARVVYAEVTSHKLHRELYNYLPPETLFG